MATGPEHYREAESLLEQAERKRHKQRGQERYYLEAAQVHATLALAAATASPVCKGVGQPLKAGA